MRQAKLNVFYPQKAKSELEYFLPTAIRRLRRGDEKGSQILLCDSDDPGEDIWIELDMPLADANYEINQALNDDMLDMSFLKGGAPQPGVFGPGSRPMMPMPIELKDEDPEEGGEDPTKGT
jgi:hypothetical protein